MYKRGWKATGSQYSLKIRRRGHGASVHTEIESYTFVRTSNPINLTVIFPYLVASPFPDYGIFRRSVVFSPLKSALTT